MLTSSASSLSRRLYPRAVTSTPSASPVLRPPLPPFTASSAAEKVRRAEDAWNGRDPATVALAYTPDTAWRNRSQFLRGRAEVRAFLARKWQRERDYRLVKSLWAYGDDRIAVRFAYEYCAGGRWFRAHGNENWAFGRDGLMRERHASINDVEIEEGDRLLRWEGPRRPDGHPGLEELGL